MVKKLIILLLVVFMGLSVVYGNGRKEDNSVESSEMNSAGRGISRQGRGNVLTLALASTPKKLDPILYTGVYESNVIQNVADTLVKYNTDLSAIIPNLATNWSTNNDGKVYTFQLRDDVYFQKGKFQNGRQMKAADVKFALERSARKSAMNRLSMVSKVEVIDDYTVDIYLKEPNAAFLTVLSDAGNVIVPEEEVKGWGDMFGNHLVGTGAFTLIEFKNDQEVILERNDNYWGEKSKLDGFIIKFITDPNQMANALRTGEIDIATDVGGESVKIIKDDPNLILKELPGLLVAYVYMNLIEGPTADIRVRKAIIKSIDIDEMLKGVYPYNEAQRAYLSLPPGSWGYDSDLEKLIPSYDPEEAKKLMNEAGYPDGFKTTIYVSNKPARVKMSTIMQSFLKLNLNIDLEIKTVEWGTFSEVASSGTAPLYGMSWTWYPDPYFFLNKMFHSSEIGSLGNGQGYNNSEVDKLLNKALVLTDLDERAVLYKQALRIITENYSRINYSNEKVIYGFNPAVKGFNMRADQIISICTPGTNVWIDE